MMSADIAEGNLAHFKSRYCLIGHSHVPLFFECGEAGCSISRFLPDTELMLGEKRLIINPGGVGQPRDGDPRASYAIYDGNTGKVRLRRVVYDIATTQERMAKYGLPQRLIGRLAYGV